GMGCLAVVGLVWAKLPELRRYEVRAVPIASGEQPAAEVPAAGGS
ncbi:MAG: hypothetical protein IH609_03285, partial [Dehalococcoidia bacterium]|nr:hypothetical protein [Dehalococcoidia bacterium]